MTNIDTVENDLIPSPLALNEFELDTVSGGGTPTPAAVAATAALVGGLAALGKAIYDYVDRHTPEVKIITD